MRSDSSNEIAVINTRHEQGVAYMAFGYAQSTRNQGYTQLFPDQEYLIQQRTLSTAYACNSRVLAITGQIPSSYIGRELGILHEIPNQDWCS